MKIELRKTEKIVTGNVFYSVYVDDRYIDNSTTMDLHEAEHTFEVIRQNGGSPDLIEVIKTTEI